MLPLWLKLVYTAFLAVIVPAYWARIGVANFLWFSDIALFGTGFALWTENRLVASAMLLAVLIPELVWNLSYFGRLLAGLRLSTLADYMFDARKSQFMRGLSLLLHTFMPAVLIYVVVTLGYEPRALWLQTAIAWIVLPVTYAFTDPEKNINWVFRFGARRPARLGPKAYVAALMVGFPLVIYLPTHFLLRAIVVTPPSP